MSRSERNLLRYFNGTEEVYGDPLEIDRRLLKYARDMGVDLDAKFQILQEHDDPMAWVDQADDVLPAMRHALQMPPINPLTGQGATEMEVLEAFRVYGEFQQAVKKKAETSPSSSPSTDGPPAGSEPGPTTSPLPDPATRAPDWLSPNRPPPHRPPPRPPVPAGASPGPAISGPAIPPWEDPRNLRR
jgi:hypothetical protein